MISTWRKVQPLALLVAATILVAQFAIPMSRLLDDDEASRFGWQMFSGSKAFPDFVVETGEGAVGITLSEYLLRERVEIDVESVLPPHLCRVIPGAIVVTWEDGEFLCSPG